jgi:hypothetical protein
MPKLTMAETAALFALMAEGGSADNTLLKERYGFTLTGKERTTLNREKLVTSVRKGRSLSHTLEDAGWAACRDAFAATPPPRAGAAGGALYAVMRGIGRYLDREELSLADVFRASGSTPLKVPEPRPGDLESRIREAYERLARHPGDLVRLADLRPLLNASDRSEVDAVLLRLGRGPRASVMPNENQKSLTQADHDAAVLVAGRPHHLIRIED